MIHYTLLSDLNINSRGNKWEAGFFFFFTLWERNKTISNTMKKMYYLL